jgi:hypothetical protein
MSVKDYYKFILCKEHYEVEICEGCGQKTIHVIIPVGIITEIKRQERIARNRRSNRACYHHEEGYVSDAFYDRE